MTEPVPKPWVCPTCHSPGVDLRGCGFNADHVKTCFQFADDAYQCVTRRWPKIANRRTASANLPPPRP